MAKVSVWLRGGLGNQLFQYSAGLVAAEILGADLILRSDLLPLSEDKFKDVSRWPEQLSTFSHQGMVRSQGSQPPYRTSTPSKFITARKAVLERFPDLGLSVGMVVNEEQLLFITRNSDSLRTQRLSLDGYFLDSRIPYEVEPELRHGLATISNPHPKLEALIESIEGTTVLHLRLGDHLALDPDLADRLGQQVRSVRSRLSTTQRVKPISLFTDSPREAIVIVRQAGFSEVDVIDTSDLRPIEVLTAMGTGSGLVASASTFAWWAAFLQDEPKSTVFMDTQRFPTWSKLSRPGWISLKAERPED